MTMKKTAAIAALLATSGAHADFVKVNGTHLELSGKPYTFVGTNLWYGMNLGSAGPGGDRARLSRELDRLAKIGVRNLRVLGASEGPGSEPWRIVPALQNGPGVYDEKVLAGLDFLLDEMRKRDMRAVVVINNFWPWSGGMSQYLAWAGNGPIPYPPPQPGGTWPGFESFTGAFYSDSDSVRMANDTVRMLVSRVSSTSGLPYANDPAIMAWELANEPRGESDPDSMDMWIDHTSTLIKSLDSNHLVTTGSEGETAHPDAAGNDLVRDHSFAGIDYATAHVWAQNWGWFDPKQGAAGLDDAIGKMRAYVADHFARATQLGKPIVFEEFGLARDGGSYAPGSPTTLRDRYYGEVFSAILGAARAGTPAAGVNFWAWAGEGKPRDPGTAWRSGDTFIGDPPHEMQGWYSVYAEDASTIKVISDAALRTAR